MGNAPVVRICFTFSDRDTNTADIHFYLPFDTPVATVFDFAYGVVPYLHAISDATVTRITVRYAHTIDTPPEPPITSELQRKLLLFLGEEDSYEALKVPSPRQEIFEDTGPYAGIRLDMSNPTVQAFATNYPLWSIPLCTEDGEVIAVPLVTGGLAL